MTSIPKYFLAASLSILTLAPTGFAEETQQNSEPKQEIRIITLEEAKKRVLASDQTIRNAYLEIKKAELQPWSALTKYTPRINGSGSYNNSQNGMDKSERVDSYSAGISYQQPLLDLSFFPAYELAKLTKEASQLDKKFKERDVILGLVKAYYDLLKQKHLIELDQEILSLTQKQLELAQVRFSVGDISSLDVTRAQLDVENAKNQLVSDSSTLALSKTTLASILNLDDRKNYDVTEPPMLELPDEDYETLLQRAYNQREDYAEGALAIDQSKEKKNQVLAEYAPTVSGQLNQQWSQSQGKSDTPWSAGISVSVPFFDGGQRELDLKNADYLIEQSRITQESLSKSIQLEVKTAWLNTRELRQKLINLTVASETAQQIYNQTEEQYKVGAATSLDVLVSLRDLNQAKTNFVTAQYDYLVSLWTLQRVTADLGKDTGEQKGPS